MKCDTCLNKDTIRCDDCHHNPMWDNKRFKRKLEDFFESYGEQRDFHQIALRNKKEKEYLDRQ